MGFLDRNGGLPGVVLVPEGAGPEGLRLVARKLAGVDPECVDCRALRRPEVIVDGDRKDGRSITLLLLDRHLKDASGRLVGIRTVFAPVGL